jgi:tetratricopeptide (TPR) repeat protein
VHHAAVTTDRESRGLEQRTLDLLGLGRFAQAEASARLLVGTDPQSATGHRLLARALSGQDRHADAIECAREACRLDPEAVASWVDLADCAIDAGDGSTAVDAAERAVTVGPHSWPAHYTLARSLMRAPGHSTRSVSSELDAAERLAPASAQVANLRGVHLLQQGDRRGARKAFQRALELDPHATMALNNLATLDVKRRPGRSAELLSSATALDPQEGLFQRNLAVTAWNIVVYLNRALFCMGTVVAFTRAGGLTLGARVILLMVGVLACLAWSYRRFRRLPRGYRRSPSTIWTSFERRRKKALLAMALMLLVVGAVALGPTGSETLDAFTLVLIVLAIRRLLRRVDANTS